MRLIVAPSHHQAQVDMAIDFVVVDTEGMLAMRVVAFPAFTGSGGLLDRCLRF
jgi:hypothetical protein